MSQATQAPVAKTAKTATSCFSNLYLLSKITTAEQENGKLPRQPVQMKSTKFQASKREPPGFIRQVGWRAHYL